MSSIISYFFMRSSNFIDNLSKKYAFDSFEKFQQEAEELWRNNPIHPYIYDNHFENNGTSFILTLIFGNLIEDHPDNRDKGIKEKLSMDELVTLIVKLGFAFKKHFRNVKFDIKDDKESTPDFICKEFMITVPA